MVLPKLQIALDTFDLPTALNPLQKCSVDIDVIEAGTILCLSEGMKAISILRSLYPEKKILADVRIAEAGSIISKMAFRAGADWVSVVSGATPATIESVCKEAAIAGGEVQVELIDGWTWQQVNLWQQLGVTQVITHRSRDGEINGIQSWTQKDFDLIHQLNEMGFKVTVTGGITPDEITHFSGVPVYIFIAGRGIYQSDDPANATKNYKKAICKSFERKD